MPKFLMLASYTTEGIRGVLKEGGSGRVQAVEKLLADVGGTLESFYFAFGSEDVYIVADLPDNTTAAAISMKVGAAGAATLRTVPLLTPDEIDRAAHTTIGYRPPGE